MHPDFSRTFMRLPGIAFSPTCLLGTNISSPSPPYSAPASAQAQVPVSLSASPVLEPEEMAHIITELQSSTVSEERRRVLLKLVGIEDESCACADALEKTQTNRDGI